jgi:hypothetical protein
MAGSDETMRLVAEVVDRYSGPLREMQKSMRRLGDVVKGTHTEGTKQTKDHEKAYQELHKSMNTVRNTISSSFTPAMATLGITTLSVSGAIAGVVESVKKLGQSYYGLQDASKRAGLSTEWVRAMTVAFQDLGIAPEAAQQSMADLGASLDQLARRTPDAVKNWNKLGGAYAQLGAKLMKPGVTRNDQFNDIFDYFAAHPNMPTDQARRFYSDILKLPPELATRTSKQIQDAIADGFNFAKEHPYDAGNAETINKSLNKLRNTLDGVESDFGNAFGSKTAGMINNVANSIDRISRALLAVGEFLDRWSKKTGVGSLDKVGTEQSAEPMLSPLVKMLQHYFPEKFDLSGGALKLSPLTMVGVHSSVYGDKKSAEEATKKGTYDGLMQFFTFWKSSVQTTPGGMPVVKASYSPGSGYGGSISAAGGTGNVPAGSGGYGKGLAGGKQGVAAIAANEWRKAGMGDTGTAGVMYNVGEESSFNPNLRHADQPHFGGEAHFAHGLYQEGGTEWNHYSAWLQKNYPGADWRDPALQSRFAAWNLRTNYPKVWARMKNAKTREDAAAAYASGYLKPAQQYLNSRLRSMYGHGVPSLDHYTGGQEIHDVAALHGAALRKHFGHPPQRPARDLLTHSQRADLQGFKSEAALRIDVNAPPGSISTKFAHSGFKDVDFNRGLQMAKASKIA